MIHFSNEVWGFACQLGMIAAALWTIVNVTGFVWAAGVNYVNDNTEATNFLPWWKLKGLDEDDEGHRVLLILGGDIIILLSPLIILGLISIYPVPLFILTTYGVLRLARGAKRLSRKLTVHVKDPEAHKNA